MAQSLVGSYSIATTDSQNYAVDFSIPDNCEFTMTQSGNTVTIRVQLKKGQTQPSTTFVDCKELFSATTGTVFVNFEQVIDTSAVVDRPKIRIDV